MAAINPRVNLLCDFLTCRNCMQLFDNKERFPKLLDCLHSICEHCVQTLTANDPSQVSCPCCQMMRQIPPAGLPDNQLVLNHLQNLQDFVPPQHLRCGSCNCKGAVAYCVDWAVNVCKECIDTHHLINLTTIPELEFHLNDVDEKMTGQNKCEHVRSRKKRFLTMFRCTRKSQMAACSKCSAKTLRGRITSVKINELQDHNTRVQNKLLELLTEQCKDKRRFLDSLLSSFDEYIAEVDMDCKHQEQVIDDKFRKLMQDLNKQHEKAHLELHKSCDEKKRVLQTRKDKLRGICSELQSAFAFAEYLHTFSSPEECLELQQKVGNAFINGIHLWRHIWR